MAALQEPKKPLASYLLYATATREAVQKELGTKDVRAVANIQSERWKVLPAAEKQKYEKQAAAAKEQCQKEQVSKYVQPCLRKAANVSHRWPRHIRHMESTQERTANAMI